MPHYRFPVLLCEDFEGFFTGLLVDNDDVSAVGNSLGDVISQLKDYLKWRCKDGSNLPNFDFLEPQLQEIRVGVRPQYSDDERVFPCPEPVEISAACVDWRTESGIRMASIPLLGICFGFQDKRGFEDLVVQYVQEALSRLTPRELSRHLPLKSCHLSSIAVYAPAEQVDRPTAPKLPTLETVGVSLDARSVRKRYWPAWGREELVDDLVRRLSRERASVIVVGEPGAGKSTVIVAAVRRLRQAAKAREDRSKTLGPRHWLTSAARLIAGMRYLGQWQERCEDVISELSEVGGVLFAENLLDLVQTGGQGPGDGIAAFFMPYLQRGELRLVAEATPSELDACRRLLPGFVELCQALRVPAFDRPAAIAVLDRVVKTLQQNLRLKPERGLTELVYRLHRRFMPYHALPGRAAAFLTKLFDRCSRSGGGEVARQSAVEQFIAYTGMPELFLRDDLKLERSEVLQFFKERILGQDEACEAATDVVMTFKAGLNDPNRPVAVLLFCGPTGVGKTQMAKCLSDYFFGHGEERSRLIQLDMSEYSGADAAERLLGKTSGGRSELIKRVRQQPFVVVLFDEIEKAAPDVFDVLLNVLDEGRLTDAFGRVTYFRSAIIVMTSNLGAGQGEPFGFGRRADASFDAEAQSFFRPEFYNRLDAVVTFNPLDRQTIERLTVKELEEISRREGLRRAGLRLAWTPRLIDFLVDEGFDRRYGARRLQRTIETLIIAPLARFLLERPPVPGERIIVDRDDSGAITIACKPP